MLGGLHILLCIEDINWRPPSLSELSPIIFNISSEASKSQSINLDLMMGWINHQSVGLMTVGFYPGVAYDFSWILTTMQIANHKLANSAMK